MTAAGEREAGHWPAWMDDLLDYGPLAELEDEWRAGVAEAIVRQLDLRAGLIESPKCVRCGSLLTLHCTIVGCGLPRPSWWQRFRARPAGVEGAA